MAARKLRAGTLAPLALVVLALGSACYSTTPHRAHVASKATPRDCTFAARDVFARSGFVQLPPPAHLSMFFWPRIEGPYRAFPRTGAGVGVTIDPADQAAGSCRVTLEALSPDVDCPGSATGPSGTLSCQRPGASAAATPNVYGGGASAPIPCPVVTTFPGPSDPSLVAFGPRPIVASTCQLSYAPGADNDAAVDELARRVRAALGPGGRVN
jgi:hypothetical protein